MLRTVGIGSKRQPRARRLSPIDSHLIENDYVGYRDRDFRGVRYRHRDGKRWRVAFARCAAVAYDALEEQDRPRAIEIMCQVVCLEHAIALTGDGEIRAQSEMRSLPARPQTAADWQALGLSSPDQVWTFNESATGPEMVTVARRIGPGEYSTSFPPGTTNVTITWNEP